jgi:hypothetical protein
MIDPGEYVWLPFLSLGWIVFVIAASIFVRKRQGKPIFPNVPNNALFSERRCSGRSLQTPWSRIGGARNCLLVVVTPQKLVITPLFPFNLMFLPEIYGLDYCIDLHAIREAAERKTILGWKVAVAYADPKELRMELRLRNRDAFLRTLRQLGVPVQSAISK